MSSRIESLLSTVRISELPQRRACRVEPATTLAEVYERLDREHGVAVLVSDGDELVGIFTERDILLRTALEDQLDRPVSELMTTDVVTIDADARLSEAVALMNERHIRHLPLRRDGVVDGTLVGGRDILGLIADYFPEALLNLPPRLHQTLVREDGG